MEILVEEPSAEEPIRAIARQIVGDRAKVTVHNLESKYKLLKNLPSRLSAYRDRIDDGEDLRILVLVDRDSDDCVELKGKLETVASQARLVTKTASEGDGFQIVNRIVVEELESWFLGDPAALRSAFPRLPTLDPNKKPFRNPDNGGTAEVLARLLKKHGIYGGKYPKIEGARRVAPHLDPDRNRSASFHAFRKGVEALL